MPLRVGEATPSSGERPLWRSARVSLRTILNVRLCTSPAVLAPTRRISSKGVHSPRSASPSLDEEVDRRSHVVSILLRFESCSCFCYGVGIWQRFSKCRNLPRRSRALVVVWRCSRCVSLKWLRISWKNITSTVPSFLLRLSSPSRICVKERYGALLRSVNCRRSEYAIHSGDTCV